MNRKRSHLPLIAVDRDGTLIEEGEYLAQPRQVHLLPGAVVGLKRLQKAGYRVAVLSNQSGVGRGLITRAQAKRVAARFLSVVRRAGGVINSYQWCPHHPDAGCLCRKPGLGMLKRAARELRMSWKGAISVGDRPSDVQVGQRARGKGVLVLTGYGRQWQKDRRCRANKVAKDFRSAVSWILKEAKGRDYE